jgi:hypothetical protein
MYRSNGCDGARARPQHVDALHEQTLLSFAAGKPADAVADLAAALRLSPRAANAYDARGLAAKHSVIMPTPALASPRLWISSYQ